MDLSIVIVNYNVKHFLIQCLQSISQSVGDMQYEILVVDNASTDGSREEIPKQFPEINYQYNTENIGFGKANNQAIMRANGTYCLLLNPDTILQRDTLQKCVTYLENHPKIGGLGVKMIDGSGQFLPESKRSFPSPEVAFYKLFGLSKLNRLIPRFGQYHLDYLDADANHEVDVLSGAFLMSRTALLQELGGFDESYFMYGEDIDLSFQIQQKGYKNCYFAESTIVHYKGESTKKSSINYVKHFYEAMVIFAKKNLPIAQQRLLVPFLNGAVGFRALLTLLSNFMRRLGIPLLDLFLSYVLIVVATQFWLGFKENISAYSPLIYSINYPLYVAIGLVTMFFSGGYDEPYQMPKIIRGGILTFLFISLFYAFLPVELRFSRMMILVSAICITCSVLLVRMILQYLRFGSLSFYGSRKRTIILVGSTTSLSIKEKLLASSSFNTFFGLVECESSPSREQIATIQQLGEVIESLNPTDIIFDTQFASYTDFIHALIDNKKRTTRYYTTFDDGDSLIYSSDRNTNGQIVDLNEDYILTLSSAKRNKRVLDCCTSLLIILAFPIFLFLQKRISLQYLKDAIEVLLAKKSWVGYVGTITPSLPKIKPGILNPTGQQIPVFHNQVVNDEINARYAKYYSVYQDIDILINNVRNL